MAVNKKVKIKTCSNCGKEIKYGYTLVGNRYYHLYCEPFCKKVK